MTIQNHNGPTLDADARRAPRRKVLKTAEMRYGPELSLSMPCAVRDLSETGVRVDLLQDIDDPPDRFDILIELDGIAASCEVIRRDGKTLGCRFISEVRLFNPKRSQVLSMTAPGKKRSLLRKPIDI